MPLDFPNSPALNDTWHASNNVTYRWDGFKWVVQPVSGGTAYLPLTGGTMQGPIVLAANAAAPLQSVPLQQLTAAIAGVPTYTLPPASTTVRGGVRVDGTTVYMTGDVLSAAATGAYLPLGGGTLTGGLHFGAAVATAVNDLTRHIDLYGGTYGFSITGGQLNYVASTGASHVFYGNATWWGTIGGGSLTMPNSIQSNNGRIVAQGSSNPALTAYNTAGYAGGMWCESGGTLSFGWCDGAGNPNNTRMYLNRNGDFWVSGAVTATYMHSSGDVVADAACRGGGSAINGWGLYSAPFGGYWMGFNWDGTNVSASANGGYVCTLVSSTWVSNNFKNIGAYTPNQNVDVNNSPTFWDVVSGGTITASNGGALHYLSYAATQQLICYNGNGVKYNAHGGRWFSWGYDEPYGAIQSFVDSGYQGYLVKSYYSGDYVALYQQMFNQVDWYMYSWSPSGVIVFAGGGWSDRRLKKNIKPATIDALSIVNRTRVYECDYTPPLRDAKQRHLDFSIIADEIEELYPEAVLQPDGNNKYAVLREMPMILTLWRSVQQLTDRVRALESHA